MSRAPYQLDRKTFLLLTKLLREVPWLVRYDEALYDLFALAASEGNQTLLSQLLKRFVRANSEYVEVAANAIAAHVINDWHADPASTKIVATAESYESDGSHVMLAALKAAFAAYEGWQESNFVSAIGRAPRATHDGDLVILVDDFVGTGSTIVRRRNWLAQMLSQKGTKPSDIRAASVAAMEASKATVEGALRFFSPNWLKKGISDHFEGAALAEASANMLTMESKLDGVDKYSFGWGRSEALFAAEGFSVPNNVFPVFWWKRLRDKPAHRPLLARLEPHIAAQPENLK